MKSSAEVHLGAIRGSNPRCRERIKHSAPAKGILGQGPPPLNQSLGGIQLGPPFGIKDSPVSGRVGRLMSCLVLNGGPVGSEETSVNGPSGR